MAITVVGLSKSTTTGASYTVAPPAGYAAGDYFYAVAYSEADGTLADIGTPSGWTLVASNWADALSHVQGYAKVFVKVASASESNYTFTGSSASDNLTTIIALRGVDTTTPIGAAVTWNNAAAGATSSLTAPSVTPTAAGELITFHALTAVLTASNVFTAPSGMTGSENAGASPYYAHTLVSYATTAATASGTKVATSTTSGNSNTQGYIGMTFAVRAATAVSGTVTGASTFGATVTGLRTGLGATSGATVFGASVTGRRTDSGASTGSTTFGATVTGFNGFIGMVNAQTMFGAVVDGVSDTPGSVAGDTVFGATVSGSNQPVGMANGDTVFGAFVEGGTGLYFRPPNYKQHPRDRHPLIARTWIAVGMTLLKHGSIYRTYVDTDPDLITTADKTYLGGHLYFVDFEEAQDLRDAGYGQWLTVNVPNEQGGVIPVVNYSQYGASSYGMGSFGV